MPTRAPRPCKRCGAPTAPGSRYCAAHARDAQALRPYDRWRGSPASRGYDRAWQKLRPQILARDHYLCQDCLQRNRVTPATEVHHIVTVEEDPSRRLDPDNLTSKCKPCHSSITATRDSSFARKAGA